MKNINFLIISLIFAVFIFSSTLVLAEDNTTTNSTPIAPLCTDSDGGLNYFVRGQTVLKDYNPNSTSTGFDDVCLDSITLSEGYCKNNQIITQKYNCPDGCFDGVCTQVMPPNSTSNQSIGGDEGLCLDNPDYWWDQETNQCYKGFSKDIIAASCSDPDGGINKYVQAHTFGFRSVFADSRDQRIRTGGKDGCVSDNQLVEHYCDENRYIQTTYLDCPSGCQDGVCIKGKDVTEIITCNLKGSKSGNECYLAGEYSSEDQGTKWCKGTDSCTIKFTGEEGDKITWKSSCGGYQYTLQDGNDETITFDCSPGETNSTQIVETYFRNAYWQCQDGSEFKQGGDSSCKSYSLWKKYAISSCDESSSTVTSFSLSNICYPDGETPIVVTSEASSTDCEVYLKECKFGNNVSCNKWEANCQTREETNQTSTETLICKDSCPLEGKCYPFGYRKANKFCSDIGSFVEQIKADATCENNFECSSNVCVSGTCVSEGLLQKIISWFKNLFG